MHFAISSYHNNGYNLRSSWTNIILEDTRLCWENVKQHTAEDTRLSMIYSINLQHGLFENFSGKHFAGRVGCQKIRHESFSWKKCFCTISKQITVKIFLQNIFWNKIFVTVPNNLSIKFFSNTKFIFVKKYFYRRKQTTIDIWNVKYAAVGKKIVWSSSVQILDPGFSSGILVIRFVVCVTEILRVTGCFVFKI